MKRKALRKRKSFKLTNKLKSEICQYVKDLVIQIAGNVIAQQIGHQVFSSGRAAMMRSGGMTSRPRKTTKKSRYIGKLRNR